MQTVAAPEGRTSNFRRSASRIVALREAASFWPVQAALIVALLVPAVATVGQLDESGFLSRDSAVRLLYWPGSEWSWSVTMPAWLSVGAMIVSYVAGIVWLGRRRTLGPAVLAGVAIVTIAVAAGSAVNALTGWRELQTARTMVFAGRVDRVIFALWHNPAWEEVTARGLPLLALLWCNTRFPAARRWAQWTYLLLPSLLFAIYHLPGHGPSRLVDTFLIGVGFAWLALRFSFFAPLVVHYVVDAMMVISLGTMKNAPKGEVPWLIAHSGALNTTWSLALLAVIAALLIGIVRTSRRSRVPRPSHAQS
ncbi:MAG TPA: CPBP family intramembrane glutamic endopeptidase [Gemmatimonadaceae bacterium]|jgi:hypothetical protein